eukprot:TRINITY_DN11622_c2_g1_i1.p1 TRINITY_DN11622_c2_g1~~TRINITY_DN11622_c2_g1_i1.p1  ORF type:complete len:367 (+),score=139.96 TRINITY_DN11622_c2_g1_i1:157-1101(+)
MATLELSEKLRQRRLRMGENPSSPVKRHALAANAGDSTPEVGANASRELWLRREQGLEVEVDDDEKASQHFSSPGDHSLNTEDEGTGELQRRLQRQRRRMGDVGSPLQEIGNQPNQATAGINLDVDIKVRQRAMKFEGSQPENLCSLSAPSATGPGKIRLDRWENTLDSEGTTAGLDEEDQGECGEQPQEEQRQLEHEQLDKEQLEQAQLEKLQQEEQKEKEDEKRRQDQELEARRKQIAELEEHWRIEQQRREEEARKQQKELDELRRLQDEEQQREQKLKEERDLQDALQKQQEEEQVQQQQQEQQQQQQQQ